MMDQRWFKLAVRCLGLVALLWILPQVASTIIILLANRRMSSMVGSGGAGDLAGGLFAVRCAALCSMVLEEGVGAMRDV
jgi:hypothetical protein